MAPFHGAKRSKIKSIRLIFLEKNTFYSFELTDHVVALIDIVKDINLKIATFKCPRDINALKGARAILLADIGENIAQQY